jgi:hypothetical protein
MFFSSGFFCNCVLILYLCFYCCARSFGELLQKRIETSTALRGGLIEAQPTDSLIPGYIQLVAKLRRELMYFCETFLVELYQHVVLTPEADDFF